MNEERVEQAKCFWEKEVRPQMGKLYFVWAAIMSSDFEKYRIAKHGGDIVWGMGESLLEVGETLTQFENMLLGNGQKPAKEEESQ